MSDEQILFALALALGWLLVLAYRVGHSGRHARIWARPRPHRMLHQGAHAAPRSTPQRSHGTAQSMPSEAVAA